ncbi:murein L,D-transpeptidase family protein [Marinilabilia sp.]|uniref:L,D-transpeptidase family protein n=1 Tax=Marinilabilia sp. TaxID=2021252 RepID=UPI0025BFC147|nr:L,D-transpeptidase [Marinilabilia sp.]
MKIKILLFVSLITFVLAGFAIIRVETNKPPEKKVMKAGKVLAEAQFEKSPKFAKEAFQEATNYYNSAMTEWEKQNEKFILLRDYKKVSELAQKSIESSEIAMAKSSMLIANTEDLLEIRIEKTGEKIKSFEEFFGNFPLDKKHRDEFSKSKLLYSESRQAYKNRNYSSCKSKLDSVEIVINDFFAYYQEKLKNYFEDYPKWNEMVNQTLSWSKKRQAYIVIVDKFSRELTIYKDGKFLKQYSIELGSNWVGDKIQQGDKSTPEGLYKIVEKKQNGQTKYHKAFLLDYPNEEDKKRFFFNKKNGIIKHDAKIGNLIEIHGRGGKEIDWTDGCIALTDANMDEIFKLCPIGTKITIVGSTKSINELSFGLK